MHLDFRIGPVMHRAPSQKVRVLHLLEGVFDVVLAAVGQDDLFVGPIAVVGEQNGLAELQLAELIQRGQPILTFLAETREYIWGELPACVKRIFGRGDSGFFCGEAVEAYEECKARFVIAARGAVRQ